MDGITYKQVTLSEPK